MTRGFSLWLDVLRVIATIVVVLSHWAYPRFTNGDFQLIRDWNLGSDAVIVFFVISGVVIAYAAERDGNGGTFAFNRLTRLWSVMLPALLLTFIFDRIGFGIDPSAYPPNFYHAHPFEEHMLRGLSFSNEFRLFERVRLGTNGPLWSLSYEAAYYALFGVAFFMRRPKAIIVLAAIAALAGLPILLLMPAWLLGVIVWYGVKTGRLIPRSIPLALACAFGGPFLYVACIAGGLPAALLAITADTLGVSDARQILGFSDEFIWNGLIGVLTSLHLLGMARLLQSSDVAAGWIRWAAGASFSTYVTHYPALHLLDATLPDPMFGRYVVLLLGTLAISLIFASVFERNLKAMRDALRRARPQPS